MACRKECCNRIGTVVVTIHGVEVFREMIPEDNKEAFVRTILINR